LNYALGAVACANCCAGTSLVASVFTPSSIASVRKAAADRAAKEWVRVVFMVRVFQVLGGKSMV